MADADMRREAAIKRLEAKRGFAVHAAIYVIVNLLLVSSGRSPDTITSGDLADRRLGRRFGDPRLDDLFPEADQRGRHSPRNGKGGERSRLCAFDDDRSCACGRRSVGLDRRLRFRIVERRHCFGAASQHCALVERTLVGDLAGVERRRVGEQQDAFDPARRAARFGGKGGEPLAERFAHLRVVKVVAAR